MSIVTAKSPFDSIRRFDEYGNEYWSARELMPLLGYTSWNNFIGTIEKAKISFNNNPMGELNSVFSSSEKDLKRSDGKSYTVSDFKLARYFCYLTAMNGDVRKPEIASAQAYFALKTRQAETSNAIALPQTYIEALEALVKSEKNRIMMEAEKAILEEQNHQLAEAVDDLFNYSSIIRIAKFNGVSETNFKWAVLKGMSKRMNLEVKKVPSPRFEYQLLYAHDVWRYCYPEMKLPETSTLVIQR